MFDTMFCQQKSLRTKATFSLCPRLIAGLVLFAGVLVDAHQGASQSGWAREIEGPVAAWVVRVIDGDTLVVKAHIWIDQVVETRVRLPGIDAPELNGRCAEEKQLARAAKNLVETMVMDKPVVLRQVKYGKYAGRVVARVEATGGDDISAALLKAGLARRYDGGKRKPWC